MIDSAARIVGDIKELGYRVVVRDGKLLVPKTLPRSMRDRISVRRAEVVRIVQLNQEAAQRQADPDRVRALRRFMPNLLADVRVKDGRTGLLWGLSPRGVLVIVEPCGIVIAFDPEEVSLT